MSKSKTKMTKDQIRQVIFMFSASSKALMRSYLIYKCSKSSIDKKITENPSMVDVYEKSEKILQKIINDTGIETEESTDA